MNQENRYSCPAKIYWKVVTLVRQVVTSFHVYSLKVPLQKTFPTPLTSLLCKGDTRFTVLRGLRCCSI